MGWIRKERSEKSMYYMRLKNDSFKQRIPKGYVPMLVCNDKTGEIEQRFLFHVKLLKEPCIISLLELASEQFGYQEGVLRVLCDVRSFRHMIDLISKS
ncbi:hypothetical protein LUZ60_005086 [Juncus effusus]|nr:hypothetical protein LUZ60_005086 [Juncus effusus]